MLQGLFRQNLGKSRSTILWSTTFWGILKLMEKQSMKISEQTRQWIVRDAAENPSKGFWKTAQTISPVQQVLKYIYKILANNCHYLYELSWNHIWVNATQSWQRWSSKRTLIWTDEKYLNFDKPGYYNIFVIIYNENHWKE